MKAFTVGGIDPSSERIVIVESLRSNKSKAYIHSIRLNADRIEDRQLQAFDFIVNFAMSVRDREDGVSPRLYLEAPIMGVGGPGATIPQAYVSGSIMAAAAQTECWIALVNNQTWKKRALGNGNINKNEITKRMETTWPKFYKKVPTVTAKQFPEQPPGAKDQDVIDSGGLNLYGWWHTEFVERIEKRRKENG